MPELITERDLQSVRHPNFCYQCGKAFEKGDDTTRDHVPPKAIFAKSDRTRPLILRTHHSCNQRQSGLDKVVGQLIAVMHKKYPKPRDLQLNIDVFKDKESPGAPMAGVREVNLLGAIIRWVRAFHAALYSEPLPGQESTMFAIQPPFPSGTEKDGKLVMDPIPEQHPVFVDTIKRNRMAKRLDRIECYNGKCIYECTWERMDDGSWACVFALNIYNWRRLGDPVHFPQRGCVGLYRPRSRIPYRATRGISKLLVFPMVNQDPLDPFGP